MKDPGATGFGDEAMARLGALYAALDAERAAGGWPASACDACGRCCHFDEMDHTLFASALEAAYAAAAAGPPPRPSRAGRCGYQVDERCAARDGRPLGCRLYYCRAGDGDAEGERAERYHAALKAIHEEWGAPWDYRPWLSRW